MKTSHLQIIAAIALLLLAACSSKKAGQTGNYLNESKEDTDKRMAWWRDARFGMFIHWGLYAVPAGEWKGKTSHGEWIRHTAEIPLETYDQFPGKFNPVQFNADAWVKMAKDAGMKYIVITSKHHDGFSIFDSETSDFDVMATPFKRDILKELAEACRKEGIKLCFYHSIMDWHHPDYLPRRPWEKDRTDKGAKYNRYVKYMKKQLKELLTNYGDIGVLWFDGEWENTWTNEQGIDLYNYVRNLQPDIIINNRVGAGREGMEGMTKAGHFAGDFGTPEQEIPANGIPGLDWESCMTMNGNWGYNRVDLNFKSTEVLIRNLTDIASKGGNFLLNIGPTAEGLFPQESIDRLHAIGSWMRLNSESIYGTTASPFDSLSWGRCTQKAIGENTRLYLHIFEQPADGRLVLHGVGNQPISAGYLDPRNKNAITITREEDAIVLQLKAPQPDLINTVVVLDLKGSADIHLPPKTSLEYGIFINEITVSLTAPAGHPEVRYTLDGSIPKSSSPVYEKPFSIKNTATINARSFMSGKPVSGISQKRVTKVKPKHAQPVAAVAPGLQYLYFEGKWDKLPDFDAMKAVRTGSVKNFDRSAKNADGERYGFEYRGFIKIPETGVYSFFISSDDGSRLWLDREVLIDNDGLHGMTEKSGVVALEAGYHELWLRYFEATGGDDLKVFWKSEKMEKKAVPDEVLFYVQPK